MENGVTLVLQWQTESEEGRNQKQPGYGCCPRTPHWEEGAIGLHVTLRVIMQTHPN